MSNATDPYALRMCETVDEHVVFEYACLFNVNHDIGRSFTQAAQGRRIECEDTTLVIDTQHHEKYLCAIYSNE